MQEVYEKIKKKYSTFEYIGGYTNSSGRLYLFCNDCGSVFPYNAQITRPAYKSRVCCPFCKSILSKMYEDKKRNEVCLLTNDWEYVRCINRNKGRHIIRCKGCGKERTTGSLTKLPLCFSCVAEQKKRDKEKCKHKTCLICGCDFEPQRSTALYCSVKCKNKAKGRTDKVRERRKINKRLREAKAAKNGKVDYSITLSKLIKRDNHICQLCGRMVDEADYTYINDTFIAGNNYPSIDHIKPLSKGGVHQWDNVQLAHRLCNSLKCDK